MINYTETYNTGMYQDPSRATVLRPSPLHILKCLKSIVNEYRDLYIHCWHNSTIQIKITNWQHLLIFLDKLA